MQRHGAIAEQFTGDIRRRWPECAIPLWRDEAWVPTENVTRDTRDYLFATVDLVARTPCR